MASSSFSNVGEFLHLLGPDAKTNQTLETVAHIAAAGIDAAEEALNASPPFEGHIPSTQEHFQHAETSSRINCIPMSKDLKVSPSFGAFTARNTTTAFSSAIASSGVHTGRWAYEVTILSDGVLQVGWTVATTPLSNRTSVGDYIHTYAYDGHRRCVWNVQSTDCGPRWATGDVVTTAVDFPDKKIRFWLNGRLIKAFDIATILDEHTLAEYPPVYTPGLAFSSYESAVINFGGAPLQFLPDNHLPYDDASYRKALRTAAAWAQVESVFTHYCPLRFQTMAVAIIIKQLRARPHFMVEQPQGLLSMLLALVERDVDGGAPSTGSYVRLTAALKVLTDCLSGLAMRELTCSFMSYVSYLCSTHRMRPPPYPHHQMLRLVAVLMQHDSLVACWATSNQFKLDLVGFFRTKSLNPDCFAELFPDFDSFNDDDAIRKARVREVHEFAAADDKHRKEILCQLHAKMPTQVQEFLDWCMREQKNRPRTSVPSRRSFILTVDGPMITNLFYALCHLVTTTTERMSVEEMVALVLPPSALIEPAFNGVDMQRLGGHLTHLLRNRRTWASPDDLNTLVPSNIRNDPSFMKMLVLYHLAMKERVLSACGEIVHRRKHHELYCQHTAAGNADAAEHIRAELVQSVRQCAWDAGTLFMLQREQNIFAVCRMMSNVMRFYSDTSPPLLRFVPSVMADSLMDLLHYVRKTAPNYTDLLRSAPQVVLIFASHFQSEHINSPDISEHMLQSLSSVIDTEEPRRVGVVAAFRTQPTMFRDVLTKVVALFKHQASWALAANLMVKLGIGEGFGLFDVDDEPSDWSYIFPLVAAPVAPGTEPAYLYYAAEFTRYTHAMIRDHEGTDAMSTLDTHPYQFVNNLVNNANWGISELGALLSEMKEGAPDLTRRRCTAVFDLSRRLLHIVEFSLMASGRELFAWDTSHDGSKDAMRRTMNTRMVTEMVLQVLSRFAVGPNAIHMDRVTRLGLKGLSRLSEQKLLAPVVGIILNFVFPFRGAAEGVDAADEEQRLTQATDPDLTSPFLQCLASSEVEWELDVFKHVLQETNWPKHFPNLPTHKLELARSAKLWQALSDAHNCRAQLLTKSIGDEGGTEADDLCCAICTIAPIDTMFSPCSHTSCGGCIRRHLMNSQKCFFCNAVIEKTTAMPGAAVAATTGDVKGPTSPAPARTDSD